MRRLHCETKNNPNNPAAGISGSVCVNHLWPVVAGGGGMKYTINELANSKGVSQPVREALLQMADYKQLYEQVCEQYDVLAKELDATNRQVEILSDALAESRREVDAIISLARADEREACAKEAESWDCHLAAAEIRARSGEQK
jgi:phage tail tape-measure protein